ncbi:MAG TPA: OsmC family protein [Mucilaginibacter sp.]|nr:OsmC family protein [Mucilaginibacter sp.]
MTLIKTKYTGALTTATKSPLAEQAIWTSSKIFGPTDLLTVSLGSCIVTYVDFMAQQNRFETPDLDVEIKKKMNGTATKVTGYDIVLKIGGNYTATQKETIENARVVAR